MHKNMNSIFMEEKLSTATAFAQNNSDLNLVNQFMILANKTVQYAVSANVKLRAFSSPHLPYFSKLNTQDKQTVIEQLKTYNEICELVLSNAGDLADSSTLTWYALKKFNLRFPSDLFNFIEADSVVEVYDRSNVQIFRNFRFFEFSSYSLEDLLCRTWTELFTRGDESHTQSILDTSKKFYTKEITTVTPLSHVGAHRISESDSPYSYVMDATIDFLAPIYEQDRYPCGFIAIESPKIVSDMPEGLQAEEMLHKYYQRKEQSL